MSIADCPSDGMLVGAQEPSAESWPLADRFDEHWERLLNHPFFNEDAGDDHDDQTDDGDDEDGDADDPLAALDQFRRAVLDQRLHRRPLEDCAALWTWLIDAVPRSIRTANAATQPSGLLFAWTNRAGYAIGRAREVSFGRTRQAEARSVLNDFAKGIAAHAFRPGGIAIAGRIFCARHAPEGTIATDRTTRCAHCISTTDDRTEIRTAGHYPPRRLTTQEVVFPVGDLVSELTSLRKGRGVQPGLSRERVGPRLRQMVMITDDHDLVSAIGEWLRHEIARLPHELRISALGTFALHKDARLPRLQDRLQWIARQLGVTTRTARRRSDTAIEHLAQRAAHGATDPRALEQFLHRPVELTIALGGIDDRNEAVYRCTIVALAPVFGASRGQVIAVVRTPNNPTHCAIPTTHIRRIKADRTLIASSIPQPACA